MYPIICQIGPFTIYSYGLMMAAAFATATLLAGLAAKRKKINVQLIYNVAVLALVSGIIGARLFYVIKNITYYLKYPFEIIMLQRGGLSWFGGLLSGCLASIIYLKKNKLPLEQILDFIAPFVALAQAIGRIGCFLNGCCFGKADIPTQLISSFTLLFIFLILRLLQDRPHVEGQIFFIYLLLYSLKRFFIEFWRADNPVIFLGLTLFQLISILLFVFSIASLIRRRCKSIS